VLSFIGAYTNSLNLAIAGSIFFCTYSVTSFFSRPIIGRFLDHHGGDAVMYPTLAILALCMAAVGLAESNALFAIGGVLLGLSYSTVTSSGQALAIHGVPEDHIGLATSTFFIFVDLGVGVGPYMLGSLVPAYGFSSVYFGAAVIGRTGVFSYRQMEQIRSKER
jgi:MFS family permease